jgi:hypothetical protein
MEAQWVGCGQDHSGAISGEFTPLTPRLVCANLSLVAGGLNQLRKPGWLLELREAT